MPDARSAVADLVAAGNDPDALADAIVNAGFLDDIPGEDRQKLRGAIRFSVPGQGPAFH